MQMTKYEKTKLAFDKQIADMKRNEQDAGLWCACGHSAHDHNVGFTCQQQGCDCLTFTPTPAPEPAGEWRVAERSLAVVNGRAIIRDSNGEWIGEVKCEHAAQIVADHHAAQTQAVLVEALRDEIDAVTVWLHATHVASDMREGFEISLTKMYTALKAAGGGE